MSLLAAVAAAFQARPASAQLPRQGSQARRRVKIYGPKARNCGRDFDQLIEILGPKLGVFRPFLPPKCTWPPPQAPWGAAGRNCLRSFHQLVEISKRSLRALCLGDVCCQCTAGCWAAGPLAAGLSRPGACRSSCSCSSHSRLIYHLGNHNGCWNAAAVWGTSAVHTAHLTVSTAFAASSMRQSLYTVATAVAPAACNGNSGCILTTFFAIRRFSCDCGCGVTLVNCC
jgi:hypothetical protein